MKLMGNKTIYKWFIRVQLWHWSGRKRRQTYSVIGTDKDHAITNLRLKLRTTKGRVVTKVSQGKAIGSV